MKIQMETNIGTVLVNSAGHYIEIYTGEESYREDLINLWDYHKGDSRLELTLSNVLGEVIPTIRNYFDDFRVETVDVLEASIEELLEPEVYKGLKTSVFEP
jgi:hypothetical protein